MGKLQRDAEKEAFWRLALTEQSSSGLSVRGFCAREGLSEASFYSWRRVLGQREASGDGAACDDAGDFVEVCVAQPASAPQVMGEASSSALELLVTIRSNATEPARWKVLVRPGFDAATLRRLVEALS